MEKQRMGGVFEKILGGLNKVDKIPRGGGWGIIDGGKIKYWGVSHIKGNEKADGDFLPRRCE